MKIQIYVLALCFVYDQSVHCNTDTKCPQRCGKWKHLFHECLNCTCLCICVCVCVRERERESVPWHQVPEWLYPVFKYIAAPISWFTCWIRLLIVMERINGVSERVNESCWSRSNSLCFEMCVCVCVCVWVCDFYPKTNIALTRRITSSFRK